MASTFSTNLKIELIGTGEQSGSWGTTTNSNLGTALEEAVVGQGTANFAADADLTLTLADSNASQVARALVIVATGTISATRNLVVPTINKPYIVRNTTTGGQSIVVKTSAGTGVTVPNGASLMVYADGTNVVKAFGYLSSADIGVSVQAYDADLTTWASKAAPTGDVIGTTDTQTLTNKTISVDNNTISGVAASSFVLSNASGNLDGAAAQKAIPTGDVVGTTDTQTLTNKTISYANNTLTGVQPTLVSGANIKTVNSTALLGSGDIALVATFGGTASGLTLNDGYTEEVFDVTGTTPALSPANGSIQTWTLSGNSTPTAGTWNAGQSITLMIDDSASYTMTWTSLAVTWKTDGGVAPTLNTTGYTAIALWKVGTVIYGARVGDA